MKSLIVNILGCKPGMKIARTIVNDYGATVIAKDSMLDQKTIEKLIELGFEKVLIYEESKETINGSSSQLFQAQYKENTEVIKSVLKDIGTGKKLDTNDINKVSDSIIVRIGENRDIISCINQVRDINDYTYMHSINVSMLCMLIGKWLKYSDNKIKQVVNAGLLHDIGKGKISSDILNKPGVLTNDEYEEIKKHTTLGYHILKEMNDIEPEVSLAVLMHHERDDGNGYPIGLKGEAISEFAKIISVADIFDAMTSERVYKKKDSPFMVFELMQNNVYGVLDPKIVNIFLSNISAYYVGEKVKLNTGDIGEVVYVNQMHYSQPVVKIKDEYVDLSMRRSIKIVELV